MIRNLEEMWRYRALIWALVQRHLRARYRGSVLGFVWSFLNPLCLIAVYSLVFQYYIRFQSVENYTLFLFAGLLPWIWFSSALLEATSSISSGGSLITKAMFPPHILPVVSILTNLANFLFAIPLLLGFMLIAGVYPGWEFLYLPLVILVELVLLVGLALAFSSLNVHFRDIQHILGNLLSLLFFLCPVIYPASSVPDKFKFTLMLNPVALLTQLYHEVFLGAAGLSWTILGFAALIAMLCFVLGNIVFNAYREDFAELV